MGADVIVGLCETMFVEKEATNKAREKGTRIASTSVEGMETFAIEGILNVDYAHMVKVAERVCELWEKTDVCRVTSPLGTDITFNMKRPARAHRGRDGDAGG